MRLHHLTLTLAMCLLAMPAPAWAIRIETNTKPPVEVRGYLISDDGKTLTIRVFLEDGKDKEKKYTRSEVKVLSEIDKGRLEKLTKNDPKAYSGYAKELEAESQKGDPEAQDFALRLYLIAAYLDPPQFGNGALLSMSAIATTPAEARKYRAMAFLLDPKADVNILAPAPIPKAMTSALQQFQKAMHCYSAGKVDAKNQDSAQFYAKQKGVDEVFGLAPGKMSKQTFLQWCTDLGTGPNQTFPDDVMQIVLRAELWAIDQLSGGAGANKNADDAKWSSILQSRQASPVLPLSLKTIIPGVDPSKCHYKNGVWVAAP